MKEFCYTIKDPVGTHARPAGMLVKEAKLYPDCKIVLEKDGKAAEATKLMALMGMGVKCGDTVRVTVEGAQEEQAAAAMETFFNEKL